MIVADLDIDLLSEKIFGSTVLVLSSKSILKIPDVATTIDALQKNHKCKIFTISAEVPIRELYQILNTPDFDFTSILAIGGGSVIDAAKAISACENAEELRRLFDKEQKEIFDRQRTIIAVPTTSGTGAELSFGAIITDKDRGIKRGIRSPLIVPDWVIISPKLYQNMPYKLKAETGFDALTHSIETYLSKKSSPVVRYQSVNSIRTILNTLKPFCQDNDTASAEKMALASMFMGANLAHSSTCIPHRLQYVIGPLTNTSHAQGLAALYKGWLAQYAKRDIPEFENLCADLNLTKDEFIASINTLKATLGIDYNLTDFGLTKDDVPSMVATVEGNVGADPCYQSDETLTSIFEESL